MNLRLSLLIDKLCSKKIRAMLIADKKNIFYLTGVKVTAGFVLVCDEKIYMLVDFRYTEKAKQAVSSDIEVVQIESGFYSTVLNLLKKHRIRKIAFEGDILTFEEHKALSSALGSIKNVSTRGIVQELRMVKDKTEIRKIKKAVDLNDSIFTEIEKLISVNENIRAADIADFAFCMMQQENAMGEAFDPIVAFGKDSALPHAGISKNKLGKKGIALVDYGVVWQDYHSDLTRTYYKGLETSKFKEIYNIVSEAQMLAIEAIKPGVRIGYLDDIARSYIAKQGYGDKFGHSLGHGVGLEIHEYPHITSKNNMELKEGMVFTVEPGVYLNGFGGVRIEDIVMVTEKGCKLLSDAPKVKKYL